MKKALIAIGIIGAVVLAFWQLRPYFDKKNRDYPMELA